MEQHVEQGTEDGITFDTVLRGYDRRQVDDRLSFLRAELSAAEEGLRSSQHRTSALEGELEQARTKLTQRSDTDMENSFGFRVERILRLAEAEAKQVRSRADTEAADLIKQATADADARRQQVEQELVTRTQATERDLGEREAAVSQRGRLEATWKLLEAHFVGPQGVAPAGESQPDGSPGPDDSADTPAAAETGSTTSRDGNGQFISPAVAPTPK